MRLLFRIKSQNGSDISKQYLVILIWFYHRVFVIRWGNNYTELLEDIPYHMTALVS